MNEGDGRIDEFGGYKVVSIGEFESQLGKVPGRYTAYARYPVSRLSSRGVRVAFDVLTTSQLRS